MTTAFTPDLHPLLSISRKPRASVNETSASADNDELDAALRRARRGDEAAFATLFRAVQPRLLRYLRARVGDGFQDVASETWLRVVADLHRFRGDADAFNTWVFTIARYRAIDAARRTARMPQQLAEHYDAEDPATLVEDCVQQLLDHERLLATVRSLPADQADAVMLRHVAGLDVATVAAMLEKSPTAIRVNCHRGLRRLAGLLDAPAETDAAS